MKLVVSKFGGTSMGDAACMRRSADVAARRGSFLVAVSATSGTTNRLIALGETARGGAWNDCETKLEEIRAKHRSIIADLDAPSDVLDTLFEEMGSIARGIHLLRDCSPRALDALVSLGERMSSALFVFALNEALAKFGGGKAAQLFDARDVVRTDGDFGKARPQLDAIAALAREHIGKIDASRTVVVTQGFIGRTEDGLTTTLGRGGSDYSAALFAEAIGAFTLEIWTDVPGIATTDPRICPEARPLKEISFKEASELATFGAKVLHPATLAPAVRKGIPVFVGSSFDPEHAGTWIQKDVGSAPLMRAIALRSRQVLVTLTTPEMLHAHGFLSKIFNVFNEHRVSVDAITTSEISVSLTLDGTSSLNSRIVQDLSRFAEVNIEENLSLISLIGNNINHTPGLAKKVFDTISDVNVRMICLGASKHNFCFLVKDEAGPEVVRRLHREFVLHESH